ncbi:leucine-, isoleucine-, valine-, threonine-, and alanine-binding protein precursor [Brucella melitensis]|nr:leucine-, isoleucine-, valine-, threonine-, and alanine-binding protein precursor [Brucella melitensis]
MAFAEDYKKVTGHYPSYVEPAAVFGLQLFGEALKNVKPGEGKINTTDIALAIEKRKRKDPHGRLQHAFRRPSGKVPDGCSGSLQKGQDQG